MEHYVVAVILRKR